MLKYKVLVHVEMKVYIDVEADSKEEALAKAGEKSIADILKAEIHDVSTVSPIAAYT